MSYTCPLCGRVSHNPNDERERYCGACHMHDDNALDAAALASMRGFLHLSDDMLARAEKAVVLAFNTATGNERHKKSILDSIQVAYTQVQNALATCRELRPMGKDEA